MWDEGIPLIFTGAMRGASELGYDGLRNLANCINVIKSPNAKNRGVMVVMNEKIHSPLWLQKQYSLNIETFHSKDMGAVFEDKVHFFISPFRYETFPLPSKMTKIAFAFSLNLDEDISILEYAKKFSAIIIAGYGAGHTSKKFAKKLESIAKKIPVIICSRNTYPFAASNTYGYPGSEIDLQNKGCIMGGFLDFKKARILASLILSLKKDISSFKKYIESITIN